MASSPNFNEFMRSLAECGSVAAVDVLLTCTGNIIDFPENPRYRRLKVASDDISERLLPVQGALECLFLAGFEESGEYLVYPISASIEPLRILRGELMKLRHELGQQAAMELSTVVTGWDNKEVLYPSNICKLEETFHMRIRSACLLVQLYEDGWIQKKALSVIPYESLRKRAQDNHAKNPEGVGLADHLVVELLAWFKRDFFRWFEVPECPVCVAPMTGTGNVDPTEEESRWGGSRVEGYTCGACGETARFPRYNHPLKLIETRVGRCGEWANCFTLFCVAMGMNARYVLDWTDHVWTEVYSESQDRWLHCDSCENLCDTPLVYESGWKKTLTYVIAFSKNDIQDVTWRYSTRHTEILSRRLLCRETWLLQIILDTNNRLQANLDKSTKTELTRRLAMELVEFLSPRRAANGNETGGRTSGSLDWRVARGETHATATRVTTSPYTFVLTDEEVSSKLFHLKYCSATDTYHRQHDSSMPLLHGWQNGVQCVMNMFQKVELDWKQVYLARTEGSDLGRISWKIAVGDHLDLTVKRVSVICQCATFEDGLVIWKIRAGDKCVCIADDTLPFVTDAFLGERELTIEAELSGGRGSTSWQHAQLFRLSLKDEDKFPLDILITFQ